MAKIRPAQFVKQVRNEATKVTWPSRKETTVSTIMVFIMVVLASIFLFFTDQILQYAIQLILGLGN